MTLKNCADDAHAARRRYKKDLDLIKPDLAAYNRQKEIALGLAPGSLAASGSSTPSASSALTTFDPSGKQVNAVLPSVILCYSPRVFVRRLYLLKNEWLRKASIGMPILYYMQIITLLKTPLTEWLARSTESMSLCYLSSFQL